MLGIKPKTHQLGGDYRATVSSSSCVEIKGWSWACGGLRRWLFGCEQAVRPADVSIALSSAFFIPFQMVSGCNFRMRKMTACAESAWMQSLTVSCWSVGTWSPVPSVASAWVSVPSAGSMWFELCMFLSHEIEAPAVGHSHDGTPKHFSALKGLDIYCSKAKAIFRNYFHY